MKTILLLIAVLIVTVETQAQAQNDIAKHQVLQPVLQQEEIKNSSRKDSAEKAAPHADVVTKNITHTTILKCLDGFSDPSTNEIYQVTLAADVPDNKRPMKVYYKKEPGHVFIILEKKDTLSNKSFALVWGFYPVRPVSSIILKNVKCELMDNSEREYNAAITLSLSKDEFDKLKQKAMALSERKYNINKFNCYDYAVNVFNAVAGDYVLPLSRVKFPFLFGRGGSPCGLYKDLLHKNIDQLPKKYQVKFGFFTAPQTNISF